MIISLNATTKKAPDKIQIPCMALSNSFSLNAKHRKALLLKKVKGS